MPGTSDSAERVQPCEARSPTVPLAALLAAAGRGQALSRARGPCLHRRSLAPCSMEFAELNEDELYGLTHGS